MKKKKIIKKIEKIDIFWVFLRSNLVQGSWNFERMQAIGFCFSIIPIIYKLYPYNDYRRTEVIQRHLEFFNTHPYTVNLIIGIVIAMEEQYVKSDSNINKESINGIKIGLMGPMAGIGDPIFWGTIRPILSAVGAGIAMSGSILGPLLFFLMFNGIRITTKYLGLYYGYYKGMQIINDMKKGILNKITEGFSVLGLFVMGALVNKWTHINIPIEISKIQNSIGETQIITVQSILDQIIPGLIPLILTFLCMNFLKKKINSLYLIILFFILGILGYWIGILGM